jgi:hypothetical protein
MQKDLKILEHEQQVCCERTNNPWRYLPITYNYHFIPMRHKLFVSIT